jgi:hypothetical protein
MRIISSTRCEINRARRVLIAPEIEDAVSLG